VKNSLISLVLFEVGNILHQHLETSDCEGEQEKTLHHGGYSQHARVRLLVQYQP